MKRSLLCFARLAAALGIVAPCTTAQECRLQLLPDAGTNQLFGQAVAASGQRLIIGEAGDDSAGKGRGSAFVYLETGSGWALEQKLTQDPWLDINFGYAVDLEADRALISAPFSGFGAAYIFERSSSWMQMSRLVASDAENNDWLGESVALSGQIAMVGTTRHTHQYTTSGAVYVFEQNGTGWSETAELRASDAVTTGKFGHALALEGHTVFIGDPDNFHQGVECGAVYIFEYDGTLWTQTAKLVPPFPKPTDMFGSSVSISGNLALIGDQGTEPGAAYVFEHQGSAWVQVAKLLPQDTSGVWSFGRFVCIEGFRALVGYPVSGGGGYQAYGSAHLFGKVGSGWVEIATMSNPLPQVNDHLGEAVALAGNWAVAGAPYDDDVGDNSGSCYLFNLDCYVGDSYCFCDTASAPCGNSDPLAGCANHSSQGAYLSHVDSFSATLDDLALVASAIPSNQNGLFYMGGAAIQIPFGDGLRCVGAGSSGLFRFPVRNAGSKGILTEGPGVVSWTQTHFPQAGRITAGSTWYFQAWYRDPMGPCGSFFNLTNALTATFFP